MTSIRWCLLLSSASAALACGGGGDVSGPPDPPDPVPVATVVVAPGAVNLAPGQRTTLTATTRASDGAVLTGRSITWSTSSPAVATVSGGEVTAVAVGEATISATSEGKTGTATVVVSALAVATITVTPNPATVGVGRTVQLTAVARAANGTELRGRPMTWSTSAPGTATVSPNGLVTGEGPGTATITAATEGIEGTALVTVTSREPGIRTWTGGAPLEPSDWSVAGNWTPAGPPIRPDTARVPATADPAVLSEDVEIARLILAGGRVRNAGHRLRVRAAD